MFQAWDVNTAKIEANSTPSTLPGASAMNLVTAATALGYGANWLTGWFAFDRDVLEGFGLKADEKLAGFIHIGTPSKPAEDRPRPALSDIVMRALAPDRLVACAFVPSFVGTDNVAAVGL